MGPAITMHGASIRSTLLHRACDYDGPITAYGCIAPAITMHRASIPSMLLHRACDYEYPKNNIRLQSGCIYTAVG